MTPIQSLLQKLGILTEKVEAIEKTQNLTPKQGDKKDENTTDKDGDGEGAGDGNGTEGNGDDKDKDGEEQALGEALQAIEGLTQKVTSLETGFATYKADLDKSFNARVDAAAQEKLASGAGTPLQTGPATKEDRGSLSTKGLKGRALTVASLESEKAAATKK